LSVHAGFILELLSMLHIKLEVKHWLHVNVYQDFIWCKKLKAGSKMA